MSGSLAFSLTNSHSLQAASQETCLSSLISPIASALMLTRGSHTSFCYSGRGTAVLLHSPQCSPGTYGTLLVMIIMLMGLCVILYLGYVLELNAGLKHQESQTELLEYHLTHNRWQWSGPGNSLKPLVQSTEV